MTCGACCKGPNAEAAPFLGVSVFRSEYLILAHFVVVEVKY